MAPVPESASKAVKLWTQSLEAGYEAQQRNRVDRIAQKATGQKHVQFHVPQQRYTRISQNRCQVCVILLHFPASRCADVIVSISP